MCLLSRTKKKIRNLWQCQLLSHFLEFSGTIDLGWGHRIHNFNKPHRWPLTSGKLDNTALQSLQPYFPICLFYLMWTLPELHSPSPWEITLHDPISGPYISQTWIFVIILFPRLHFYFFICRVDFPRMLHNHSNSACQMNSITLFPRSASLLGSLVSTYDYHFLTHLGLKSQCHLDSYLLSISCGTSVLIFSLHNCLVSLSFYFTTIATVKVLLLRIITAAVAVCIISLISDSPGTQIFPTLSYCSIFTRMPTF